MPAPIQPRQPIQAGAAQAQYEANVPTSGELGLAAHVRTPFVSSHLLNAQMERRAGIAANNAAAAAAAEQQARQFDEQMKATLRGQTIGALDSDYGGWAAGQLGADPNMIAVNEALRQDKQKAEGYGKYAAGASDLAQVGAEMPTAVQGTPLEGVKFGELPAVGMNNADNATQLEQAKIAAAASLGGARIHADAARATAGKGKFKIGLSPQQQAIYGAPTLEFDTMEEMIAGQNQLAGMTGGAALGGGAGGQPSEVPIPDAELRSALPAIQARMQRDGLTSTGAVRKADGSMVVRARDQAGNITEIPLSVQAP